MIEGVCLEMMKLSEGLVESETERDLELEWCLVASVAGGSPTPTGWASSRVSMSAGAVAKSSTDEVGETVVDGVVWGSKLQKEWRVRQESRRFGRIRKRETMPGYGGPSRV